MTPTPEQIKAAHEWCSAGEAAKEWACIDIQTQFVIYTAAAAYAAHCVAEAKNHYQSEAYQVIGVLANATGLFEHTEVQRALDYFSGNGDSILPFALPENAIAETIAKKGAELKRLRVLVRRAYNEGFSEGMKDFTTPNGGNAWFDSSARAALQEKKP